VTERAPFPSQCMKKSKIHTRKAGVVDTMAQAIAETGFEPWKVKLAKKAGCGAFKRGSRVDVEELRQYISDNHEMFENPPSLTKEEADIKHKEVKIARETLALERDKGLLIRKTEVYETCRTASQIMRATLQQKLETELPTKCAGKTSLEIAEMMRETVDEICNTFHDRTKQWT
jgi:hypothetical protein